MVTAIAAFDNAAADLLERRSLQDRVDRKYLLPPHLVDAWLRGLHADYRLVRADGEAAARYETLYFDTPDRQLFHDHRRGRRPRCKVRIRHHVTRRRTFLEVKIKEQRGRTTKARCELPFGRGTLDADTCRFIDLHCRIRSARLVPCLTITFSRMILVGVDLDERVTLDWHLECHDDRLTKSFGAVTIAEIKQPRRSTGSGAARALRALNVREAALSKYCLATVHLARVPMNGLRPVLRTLEKIGRCGSC